MVRSACRAASSHLEAAYQGLDASVGSWGSYPHTSPARSAASAVEPVDRVMSAVRSSISLRSSASNMVRYTTPLRFGVPFENRHGFLSRRAASAVSWTVQPSAIRRWLLLLSCLCCCLWYRRFAVQRGWCILQNRFNILQRPCFPLYNGSVLAVTDSGEASNALVVQSEPLVPVEAGTVEVQDQARPVLADAGPDTLLRRRARSSHAGCE